MCGSIKKKKTPHNRKRASPSSTSRPAFNKIKIFRERMRGKSVQFQGPSSRASSLSACRTPSPPSDRFPILLRGPFFIFRCVPELSLHREEATHAKQLTVHSPAKTITHSHAFMQLMHICMCSLTLRRTSYYSSWLFLHTNTHTHTHLLRIWMFSISWQ